MKSLSLRYIIIFATLATLVLLGGIWVYSGDNSTSSVTSFVSKEAKSSSGTAPAAAPQQTLPESAPFQQKRH